MARDSLNELEYINGFIYANIWMRDEIVKTDTTRKGCWKNNPCKTNQRSEAD